MPNPISALASLQTGLVTIAGFLFVLSIVVVIHELGHFLVARWCGVKVDSFAMGFGREIYGRNDKHGTRWRLNWIPLGGYVKFMDDANGASIPDADYIANMTDEERTGSFHAKPLWQRAAVIFAGPFANFLLAIALFASLSMIWGVRTVPARVEELIAESPAARAGLQKGDLITRANDTKIESFGDLSRLVTTSIGRDLVLTYDRIGKQATAKVTPVMRVERDDFGGTIEFGDIGLTFPARIEEIIAESPADKAGLAKGDIIREINGTHIVNFTAMRDVVAANAGKPLSMTYDRDGRRTTVKITPDSVEEKDAEGVTTTKGRLGLKGGSVPSESTFRHAGPIEALGIGVKDSYFVLAQSLGSIRKMIGRREGAAQLGGPLKIAAYAGKAAATGFDSLLSLTALISLSVGLFNLFPIPPLDGGHLLFYGAEALRGRPLSDGAKDIGLRTGFALILMLIMLVMWNDRLVLKTWIGL